MSSPSRSRGGPRTAGLQRDRRDLVVTPGDVATELHAFEAGGEAEYLARLAADANLVNYLQWSSFDDSTDEWRQFARALAEYGYAVFRAWFGSGEIVTRLATRSVRGRGVLPSPYRLSDDDVHELAAELVARGIVSFRTNILMKGRWDAGAGATLKTYFVGHLLLLVPTTYQRWKRDSGSDLCVSPSELPTKSSDPDADRTGDRMLVDELTARLSSQTRRMFELQADGWSISEIANRLGVSESKVKTDMSRSRRRLERLYPELSRWVS